jgi:outer membrane lipoprotein-sorting protein
MLKKTFVNGLLVVLVAAGLTQSPDPVAAQSDGDPVELMKQAHMKLYYAGEDGKATVDMVLTDKKGKSRTRKFVMFRRDLEDGGPQKYFTYFFEPSDVRRTSFMVWKEPDKDDSRWIYIPAIDLVRRISANDKGSSFVGSDFSYEDVSGRHWTDDEHTYLRQEKMGGEACHVIESVPKEEDEFAKKLTWISVAHTLPVREEYFDKKGRHVKTFEALEIEEIDGYLTVTERRMTNEKKQHTTTVSFSNVEYDIGVEENVFSERYLKSPPSKLIQG